MKTEVFKFGGASVKDAPSVTNLARILEFCNSEKPMKRVVIVSAMGKTTNALENVLNKIYAGQSPENEIVSIENYHYKLIDELFLNEDSLTVNARVGELFGALRYACANVGLDDYDKDYDQIVSFGELISTTIVDFFLRKEGFLCHWADARELIITNSLFREAGIDWQETKKRIVQLCSDRFKNSNIIISQGFIGCTPDGFTTTLGREGSDFTGAIFAWSLDAESLTIWKDVPGLLNADPKIFNNTTKIDSISYGETIELAYYGATIIHPKTIKPLQNKQIPLYVKSFLHPDNQGSKISTKDKGDALVPNFIVKKNQLLMSISPRDYSFMNEEHLALIFSLLAELHIKVNMMQVSAISFSICIDDWPRKNNAFINRIKSGYKIRYNQNLDLLTIRHYTAESIADCTANRKILLEQRSRSTIQLVLEQS